MKPIVLTTLTTVGGMLPLALFAGPMWAGMAWAVIFGLGCSTALTLLVVPTVYVTMVEVFGVAVETGPPAEQPAAPAEPPEPPADPPPADPPAEQPAAPAEPPADPPQESP